MVLLLFSFSSLVSTGVEWWFEPTKRPIVLPTRETDHRCRYKSSKFKWFHFFLSLCALSADQFRFDFTQYSLLELERRVEKLKNLYSFFSRWPNKCKSLSHHVVSMGSSVAVLFFMLFCALHVTELRFYFGTPKDGKDKERIYMLYAQEIGVTQNKKTARVWTFQNESERIINKVGDFARILEQTEKKPPTTYSVTKAQFVDYSQRPEPRLGHEQCAKKCRAQYNSLFRCWLFTYFSCLALWLIHRRHVHLVLTPRNIQMCTQLVHACIAVAKWAFCSYTLSHLSEYIMLVTHLKGFPRALLIIVVRIVLSFLAILSSNVRHWRVHFPSAQDHHHSFNLLHIAI